MGEKKGKKYDLSGWGNSLPVGVSRIEKVDERSKDNVGLYFCDGCGELVSGDDLDERYDGNVCLRCADGEEDD